MILFFFFLFRWGLCLYYVCCFVLCLLLSILFSSTPTAIKLLEYVLVACFLSFNFLSTSKSFSKFNPTTPNPITIYRLCYLIFICGFYLPLSKLTSNRKVFGQIFVFIFHTFSFINIYKPYIFDWRLKTLL